MTCPTCHHDRRDDCATPTAPGVAAWTVANFAPNASRPNPGATGCPGWAPRACPLCLVVPPEPHAATYRRG